MKSSSLAPHFLIRAENQSMNDLLEIANSKHQLPQPISFYVCGARWWMRTPGRRSPAVTGNTHS
jgi:hypothetical protein